MNLKCGYLYKRRLLRKEAVTFFCLGVVGKKFVT